MYLLEKHPRLLHYDWVSRLPQFLHLNWKVKETRLSSSAAELFTESSNMTKVTSLLPCFKTRHYRKKTILICFSGIINFEICFLLHWARNLCSTHETNFTDLFWRIVYNGLFGSFEWTKFHKKMIHDSNPCSDILLCILNLLCYSKLLS